MKITAKSWNNYIGKLAKVNQKAGIMMRKYVEAHGVENTKALMDYAMALIQKYGEGSAELACQMYDAMAELSGVVLPSAEPAEIVKYKEVAKMVNATKNSIDQLERGVERLVKKAGADTTLKNAERDNAEFAWIPHGDTCAYCLSLAAQGWRHVSLNTVGNGYAEHIHANCDCEYAVRFNKKTTVQGYDPDKYSEMFENAEGETQKEKINYIRRLNQHKGTKIEITSQAIEKVKQISIKGNTEENDILIQKAHKELLRIAKEENDSNEVAVLINLNKNETTMFVKGKRHEVDIYADTEIYHLLTMAPKQSLTLCHNHPGATDFSANDISVFMRHNTIKTMTIVTNKGNVRAISKSNEFQIAKASKLMENCMDKNDDDIEKSIEEFLKKCYSVGIVRQ